MSAPVVVTRQTLANAAVDRWRGQYSDGHHGADKLEILHALEGLGQTPSPEAVNEAIGNKSWTEVPACSGCDARGCEALVQVGEVDDYESATAWLCWNCAEAAVAALRADRGGS